MPPEIEALLDSIDMLAQYMEQNGANLDPATQQELASFLQEAMQFVEEYIANLSQNPTDGLQPQVTPELQEGEHPSSNVNAFKYNPDTNELFVQFHGPYPQAAGSVYRYQEVQPYIFDIIRRGAVSPRTSGGNAYHTWQRGISPSLGASVNAILKSGNYQYQRVS